MAGFGVVALGVVALGVVALGVVALGVVALGAAAVGAAEMALGVAGAGSGTARGAVVGGAVVGGTAAVDPGGAVVGGAAAVDAPGLPPLQPAEAARDSASAAPTSVTRGPVGGRPGHRGNPGRTRTLMSCLPPVRRTGRRSGCSAQCAGRSGRRR